MTLSTAIGAGALLGRIAAVLPLREQEIARLQLARFLPTAPPETITRLFQHLGMSFIETVCSRQVIAHGTFSLEGWDVVERIRAEGRGAIALTGHLGNWDLLAAYAGWRGIPLHVVGKEARNPLLQKVLERIRRSCQMTMLWRSGIGGGREIVRLLEAGGAVVGLVDQDTTVRSQWVPFLGHLAKTPSTIVELALRSNAAIISGFLVRTGRLSYRISIQEIKDRSSVHRVLEQYHTHLESLVREFPEQWVWVHKRWRSPENASPMSSAEYRAWLADGQNLPSTR